MKIIKLFLLLISSLIATTASAQIPEPIKWNNQIKVINASLVEVSCTATIQDGWHLYYTEMPEYGPIPTTITWDLNGVESDGPLTTSVEPQNEYDEAFQENLKSWDNTVTFTQRFKIKTPNYRISGTIEFMSCNGINCIAPQEATFSFIPKAAK